MTDPRTDTWVSPALRQMLAWLEAQPPEDRDRLTVNMDVTRAFVAGYEARVAKERSTP